MPNTTAPPQHPVLRDPKHRVFSQRGETAVVRERQDCRLCGSRHLEPRWSFGVTPLANAYLKPDELGQAELSAPLTVQQCATCKLVQLREVVAPEVLFNHYLYRSSTSPTFVAHFEQYAADLQDRFNLNDQSFVVDVGSNDGILLKPLQGHGSRVLGIEPAHNIAALAAAAGVPTLADFFTPALAQAVLADHGPADVITANNVFAHTDRVSDFVDAVKVLLAPNGVFVFEVQYLKDLLDHNLFDIVYHEHLCYYHLTPLVSFFKEKELEVFDVTHHPVHGGSLRVFVQRAGGPHASHAHLATMLEAEEALNTAAPYETFAARITQNKATLRQLLGHLKASGKRIVGYGAPAKATTLCAVFGLDASLLDYIVDDDATIKQGMYMPGTHLAIKSPDELYTDKPDYCLILAWNFAEPIMTNHARFTTQGGTFIIPVPEPRLARPK